MRMLPTLRSFVVILTFWNATATGAEPIRTITNSIDMEFAWIPPGNFLMGSDRRRDRDATLHETPRHPVSITRGFWLGRHEVTQRQWSDVMLSNPSYFKGVDLPVEQVAWEDAQEFVRRLNARENTLLYRLPTEAEWEYAARAGFDTVRFFGNDTEWMEQYAWYKENSGGRTHPAGTKWPNGWGLYDMLGNVAEWVSDWYGSEHYASSTSSNPKGPKAGSMRIMRGGSWFSPARELRAAHRHEEPGNATRIVGLRVVKEAP
ncbi:MAG: formylglycine-generating enzyme family protein [Magnetococcales bacterium]|nr:formylglycine-generating enzyme family protein [Magnetococcales bacterium]